MVRGRVIAIFTLVVPAAAAGASSLLLAAGGVARGGLLEKPVMKVVRLLTDMKAQLTSDLEDDKQVHGLLDCWCKTNDKEKTAAIESGEARESELEAFLGEAAAKMEEIKTKRASALEEVDKDWAALSQAKQLRMEESKAFQKEETALIEAIKAAEQAIVVLSKHHPELAQVRMVAQRLRKANVLSFKTLTSQMSVALKAFLEEAQGDKSFLAIPGFQSYAPQSGQVFGILKQMKADFESSLGEAQAKEKAAEEAFLALKAAKEEEIATGKKLIMQLDEEFALLMEKHAEAFKELEGTKAQLALDRTFLQTLKEKCAVSDEEFAQRVKSRLEEIAAVEDTIEILNSDTSFDLFDKSLGGSFLQTSAGTLAEDQRRRQQRAASVLSLAASRTQSPRLALLAQTLRLDAFTKVKEEIDKMVAELLQQQQDEVAHRDWCIKEKNDHNRTTAAADDKKTGLEAKIADLEKTIETLTAEIEATKKEMAETEEQMKSSSEVREGENADFQQTVQDQRLTQIILQKALARMQEVYSLLQQRRQPGAAHVALSGNHTDPGNGPARFTKYEENAGGKRVVAMIQEVIADSKKTENEALDAEEDSQAAYETSMKEANELLKASGDKVLGMTAATAKAKEDLGLAEQDLKGTLEELQQLHDTLGNLLKSCTFVLDNFDARQEARAAEVDALKEAKAILSGLK